MGIDVGAKLDEALGYPDPTVERRDVERGSFVVVVGIDEVRVLLEELTHGGDVVLVGVPEDERRPADPRLLLLLLLARSGRGTR